MSAKPFGISENYFFSNKSNYYRNGFDDFIALLYEKRLAVATRTKRHHRSQPLTA
jgi:hypothetical protein